MLGLLTILGARPAEAQSYVLQDEFNGPTLDTSLWDVHNSTWYIHRTRFGNAPQMLTEGDTSFTRIQLDTYNPAYPGVSTKGTEIWSKARLTHQGGLEYETRMRASNLPRGLIMAFYTYKRLNFGDLSQQEIDFEVLGNQPSDRLWLNIWTTTTTNAEANPTVAGLDRTQWVTYKVRWYPNRVEWYVNDVLIRTENTVVPTDPMSVCFNLWASDSTWTQAYDSSLEIAPSQETNKSYYYDIDYVRVRTIATPSTPYTGTPITLPGLIQAEDYDKGGEGVAYRDNDTANLGEDYRLNEGVDVDTSGDIDSSFNISSTNPGEWFKYTVNVAPKDYYILNTRVSSLGGGGKFHIESNGIDKTGPITIPDTGGWQNYTRLQTFINLSPGPQVLKVVMDSNGETGVLGNFNWFEIEGPIVDSSPPTTTFIVPAVNGAYANPTTASGYVDDEGGSGQQSVRILLQRATDGLFWDGANWVETTEGIIPIDFPFWTLPLPALPDGTYRISAVAVDGAGNIGTSGPREFTMDSTPPTVSILAPAEQILR